MICEKCGVEMENSEKVCRNCGALQKGAKFCQHCGEAIDSDCVICPKCGKQVQQLKQEPPQVVINNTNTNTVTASATATANGVGAGRAKNILYLLTGGLFVIGAIVDTIVILMKPNPYYV